MTRPNTRQLRHFGLLVGGIFGVIALWPVLWRLEGPRPWALVLAAILVLPALVAPRVLAPAHRAWMALADGLGWVNTRIILGVVFYGLVTPMGLVMRWRGRDPMARRFDRAAPSYRVPRHPRPGTHMLRQF